MNFLKKAPKERNIKVYGVALRIWSY